MSHEVARIAFIFVGSFVIGLPIFAIWYGVEAMIARNRVKEFLKGI